MLANTYLRTYNYVGTFATALLQNGDQCCFCSMNFTFISVRFTPDFCYEEVLTAPKTATFGQQRCKEAVADSVKNKPFTTTTS